jgi:2,4-dienoyl-CoA reductase-like NADH-dependent reductase (Old Yellow Enzyme family)
MSTTRPALFQPIKVGDIELKHRVVLAPSTRFRATEDGTPTPQMIEYYAQRAHAPGTLLIAEPAFIAQKAGGFIHVPGIYSPEQIAAWKQVRTHPLRMRLVLTKLDHGRRPREGVIYFPPALGPWAYRLS